MDTKFQLIFLKKHYNKRHNPVNNRFGASKSSFHFQHDSRVSILHGGVGMLNRDLTLQHPPLPKCLESIHKQITINYVMIIVFIANSASKFIVLPFHFLPLYRSKRLSQSAFGVIYNGK